MKRLLLVLSLVLLAAASASAAEKFENKTAGLALEAPEGFTAPQQRPEIGVLGEILGFYVGPNAEATGAAVTIHNMPIPGGMEFDAFKQLAPTLFKGLLGDKFKLLKSEDTKIEKLTGFMLDFETPGDGKIPNPAGDQLHHARWFFFKGAENKMTGILYTSREDAWKDLTPKVDASVKTIRYFE
jgi:hypothetical protein